MFENLKSLYFIKFKLFIKIEEQLKLRLLKYNKNLQNKLNINIINYKYYTGNYIIYESNKRGKEYKGYNDKLIYEGEYLKGERNGKGKEYDELGNIIFEGEYLKGKRNGKGKEYFKNKLIFEGEYLNGKELKGKKYSIYGNLLNELNRINGRGKQYDPYGNLEFEGEYLNGKRNGKGKEYKYYGRLEFEGEYLNDNKYKGKLNEPYTNKVIEQTYSKGLIKEYDTSGYLKYEGEYLNGIKNGKGKEFEIFDGKLLVYEGEFLNGKRNGKGKEYFQNGKLIFEGEYLYNFRLKGKLYIKGKLEFEGEFLYNKKWNGKVYDENGNIIYELIKGNEKVKEYNKSDPLIFEGEYLNGKRNC